MEYTTSSATISPPPQPEVTISPIPTVPPPEPAPVLPKRRRRVPRVISWPLTLIAAVVIISEVFTLSLHFWTPPSTSFMRLSDGPVIYQYVSMDHISRYAVAATIAHEDQEFGTRSGPFEWEDFTDRIDAHMKGEPDPSGSTIPQQLVKNMYLWPEQSALRKGLEAGLSLGTSYSLPPKRVLELYLNYAQFGPGLYGVCAASWYYFEQPPWNISETQAAMMASMLPHPSAITKMSDGTLMYGLNGTGGTVVYVQDQAKVAWIGEQIANHGGWEKVAAGVGIFDTANAHEAKRSHPDACSTMPQSVSDRLAAEGHQKRES